MIKILTLIFIFITIVSMSACTTNADETISYEDFTHIDHWDDLKSLTAEKTIIYYYSPYCDICISLEETVTQKLKILEDYREIFLIDDGWIFEQGEPDFELFGVPALIILHDGEFYEMIRGSVPVVDYLENEIKELK